LELIAISDIYGDILRVKALTSLLGQAGSENRIIVIAGDLSRGDASEKSVKDSMKILSEACRYLFYVPGDSDPKDFEIGLPNAINLDKKNYLLRNSDISIGFIGLGGAPSSSVRTGEFLPNLWDESIPIVTEQLSTELKINIEKVIQGRPDYIILVSHSPPYGIADRSKPITLREMIVLEDILEELKGEQKPEPMEKTKKPTSSIRHLGSRIISNFAKYYKPDIHIFGHVHKEGGKTETQEATKFFNVSHLSPLPYRLTGRKFLKINITKENIEASFNHVITEKDISFDEFIEKYL
jgi:Icc-related predicted phosphoesterase